MSPTTNCARARLLSFWFCHMHHDSRISKKKKDSRIQFVLVAYIYSYNVSCWCAARLQRHSTGSTRPCVHDPSTLHQQVSNIVGTRCHVLTAFTRTAGWRGRLLSYAGRLVLLKACLPSIPIYLLSIIIFLSGLSK